MRRIIKYIISFIFILIVACSGLLCSAAVITDSLDTDQKAIILQNATGTGFNDFSSSDTNWALGIYQDYYSDASYTLRGNSNSIYALSSKSLTLNLPFYLSGFDSLTIEFMLLSSHSYIGVFGTPTFSRVIGSSSYAITATRIGEANLRSVETPSNVNSSVTSNYYGYIYQITITDPIDFLRIQFNSVYAPTDVKQFLYGFAGIYVNGTSEALANIETQVSQIGGKVDTLTSAIQNAASNIGAIVDGQGDLLTSVDDVKAYLESIDEKQGIIIYATQDDQLIIQELDERFESIKDDLDEYKDILDRYHNPPDINNVTNIIDQGLPNEFNPQVISPVLAAVFDNSIVTTILIAVGALMLMSYILFGKKG